MGTHFKSKPGPYPDIQPGWLKKIGQQAWTPTLSCTRPRPGHMSFSKVLYGALMLMGQDALKCPQISVTPSGMSMGYIRTSYYSVQKKSKM